MQRFFILVVGSILIMLTFFAPYTLAQGKDIGTPRTTYYHLMFSAKDYITAGNKQLAEKELDQAFKLADQAKNPKALQEIGDLYLKIDMSLQDKAKQAWHRAGYWRSQGY